MEIILGAGGEETKPIKPNPGPEQSMRDDGLFRIRGRGWPMTGLYRQISRASNENGADGPINRDKPAVNPVGAGSDN